MVEFGGKTWGRNQQRQLLDELQRIQQQVRGAVGSRMRQLEHHLPARALRQPLQRQRRVAKGKTQKKTPPPPPRTPQPPPRAGSTPRPRPAAPSPAAPPPPA